MSYTDREKTADGVEVGRDDLVWVDMGGWFQQAKVYSVSSKVTGLFAMSVRVKTCYSTHLAALQAARAKAAAEVKRLDVEIAREKKR